MGFGADLPFLEAAGAGFLAAATFASVKRRSEAFPVAWPSSSDSVSSDMLTKSGHSSAFARAPDVQAGSGSSAADEDVLDDDGDGASVSEPPHPGRPPAIVSAVRERRSSRPHRARRRRHASSDASSRRAHQGTAQDPPTSECKSALVLHYTRPNPPSF